MKRRTVTQPDAAPRSKPPARKPASPTPDTVGHSAMAQRLGAPHTREEAETRYTQARDAWAAAMRAANSGRPADLAALALAQQTYEAAAAERERWLSGMRVALPVESDRRSLPIDRVVDQELAWRRVRTHHEPAGLGARLRRFFGRR